MTMRRFYQTFLITTLCCIHTIPVLADWTQMETGIDDHFTGLIIQGDTGLVSGYKGIYYTIEGINDPMNWHRLMVSQSPGDVARYERSRFHHCYSVSPDTGYIYACGKDTITNRAIIVQIHLPTLESAVIFMGRENTSLNHIGYSTATNMYYAVGNNGFVVRFNELHAEEIQTFIAIDLLSISIFSNTFWIGADNYMIWGSDISEFDPFIYPTPETYRDAIFLNSQKAYGVGDAFYICTNGTSIDRSVHFDLGPLEGNAIIRHNSYFFVATDHGIYRSTGETVPSVIEWMPTAGSFRYRKLWVDDSSGKLYACGDNGRLIETGDYGGLAKPCVRVWQLDGECVNAYVQYKIIEFGTATSCKWYENGQHFRTGCSTFSRQYKTTGFYQIDLEVSNGVYLDTASQSFYVVERPIANLPITLADSTLCKGQAIEITLNETQPDVFYSLFLENGSSDILYGSSDEGSSGMVSFSSAPIHQKGSYYLKSSSSLADCHTNFSGFLPLTIELTEADFAYSPFNAQPDEEIIFFENATDAVSFEWTFPSTADKLYSSLPDPTNVLHTAFPAEIELNVTSQHGCTSSITKSGPNMYSPTVPSDPCWINHAHAPDLLWQSYYHPHITQIRPSKTGYFICGQHSERAFPTQHGDSLMHEGRGSYVAKYDFDGTIKWVMRTKRDDVYSYDPEYMISVDEDSQENVYVTGNLVTYGSDVYDNSGAHYYFKERNHLTKLNKHGEIQWYLSGLNLQVGDISFDSQDNLVVLASSSSSSPIILKNGQPHDTLNIFPDGNRQLIKISPDGDVIWTASITLVILNSSGIAEITVDAFDNIYVLGGCERQADFYSTGDATLHRIQNWENDHNTMLFLVKYNTSGVYQWGIRSATMDILLRHAHPYAMLTDAQGNCYISGRNTCNATGCKFVIEGTDSSLTTVSAGGYFVAKVNTIGQCEWIQSNSYTYYGYGYGMSLYRDELSVWGAVRDQSGDRNIINTELTSHNGSGIRLEIMEGDFFIAVYDTLGNLLRVHTNGFNSADFSYNQYENPGIFQREDGSYYLAQNVKIDPGPYTVFGDQIQSTSGIDGYVVHFDPSCAVTYWPGYSRVDTVYVCQGTQFVFPNGEVRVIERPTAQSSYFPGVIQDTTIITNVKILEPLSTSLTKSGDTLRSIAENVQYQWLRCDQNYTPVLGANGQEFIPETSGTYAVELTATICRDTSECIELILTGIESTPTSGVVSIYPNPSFGSVSIDLGELTARTRYRLYDCHGKMLSQSEVYDTERFELNLPTTPGVYVLQLALKDVVLSSLIIRN